MRALSGRAGLPLAALLLSACTMLLYHGLLDPRAISTPDHIDFYLRVTQYAGEFRAGHWPQTLPDAFHGGGHAFPRFYPPFSHLAAVMAGSVVAPIILACHLSLLAAPWLGGVAMFALLRRLADTRVALLGAICYVAWPYTQVILLMRGAAAEAWTLPFYPLLLLGLLPLRDGESPRWWWPLSVAGLLLSHTVMALWTLPVFVAAGLLAARSRADRLRTCADVAVGVALAAAYLVPMRWYFTTVRVSEPGLMWTEPGAIVVHGQWWLSPMVLGAIVVLWGVVLLAVARRSTGARPDALLLALAVQLVYLGFYLAPSAVWAVLPEQLRYIQFPMRLLAPLGFWVALATALALQRLPARGAVAATILGLLWLLQGWVTVLRYPPHDRLGTSVAPLADEQHMQRGMTVLGEYLPRGADPTRVANEVRRRRSALAADGVTWTDDEGVIDVQLSRVPEGPLLLPLVAYDFVRVVDATGRELPGRSNGGLLEVDAPVGTLALRITRRLPPAHGVGIAVSGMALLLVVLRRRNRTYSPRLRHRP